MIREIEDNFIKTNEKIEKILVCITAQCNSKRLIDEGARVADLNDGELHILHVQQGDSIFNNSETPKLLEELFNYASQKGGMVHFYCDEDVSECIGNFVNETGITKVVLGEPPVVKEITDETIREQLKVVIRHIYEPVDLIIVRRQEGLENIVIKKKGQ